MGIWQTTISRYLRNVCKQLLKHSDRFIHFPIPNKQMGGNEIQLKEVVGFLAIGALDCTHIQVQVRLLKLKRSTSVLSKCSAVHSLSNGLRLSSSFGKFGSSFLMYGNWMQKNGFGGAIRRFIPAIIGQVGSVHQYHKLFLGNLPKDATEDVVHKHFSQFGMLLSVYIVRDAETLESQGRGFVVFAEEEAMNSAVSSKEHIIKSHTVTIRPHGAISFLVEDLLPLTTSESLYSYFSRYGKVRKCVVKHNPFKNSHNGYVNFHLTTFVDQGLASGVHIIDGKQVEVIQLVPKELTQYVGNLSPSTTDESLAAFYSQFGTTLQAQVKKDRLSGQSRGFGYVTFSSQKELDNALLSLPHVIDGSEVKLGYETQEFTLFFAELPANVSERYLKQFFEQFGPVYDCKIAREKQTNQLLYHGWVVFLSQQGLLNALAARPLVIDGKQISAKSSEKKVGQACTMFVGQLSPQTSDQMLHDAFSKFGSLVGCRVKHDRESGKQLGYGFVTYSTVDEVSKALLARPHVIDGKVVCVIPQNKYSVSSGALPSPVINTELLGKQ